MSLHEKAKTLFTVKTNGDFPLLAVNSPFLVREEVQNFEQDSFADTDIQSSHSSATEIRETYLRFTVDHFGVMKDSSRGFVFGEDAAVCDVVVKGSQSPKPQLFVVAFVPENHAVLIRNLTRHGINLTSKLLGRKNLKSQRALVPGDSVTIVLSDFKIDIEVPKPETPEQDRLHQRYWADFCEQLRRAAPVPSLGELQMQSRDGSSQASSKRYYLRREIGRGSFGTVYSALDLKTGDIVAAKIFKTSKQSNSSKEAAILQSLSHDNIVKYISFISSSRQQMLIMGYISGPNLESSHAIMSFSLQETQRLVHQLLCGINYLHSRDITHRDLKPANILVQHRSPLHIKLTDFGLATAKPGSLETFCGSQTYMAPEVGQTSYTNSVDMWAVGVIALELIAGLPKDRNDRTQWPLRLEERLQTVSSKSAVAHEFLDSLLQIQPHLRATAAQSLQHPFITSDLGPIHTSPLGNADGNPPSYLFNRRVLSKADDTAPVTSSEGMPSTQAWGGSELQVRDPTLTEIHDRPESPRDALVTQGSTPDRDPSTQFNMMWTEEEAIPSFRDVPTPQVAGEIWTLNYKDKEVMYMADQKLINVTQVLKIYDLRHKLSHALKTLGDVRKEIKYGGRKSFLGTYVSFRDAHRILRCLGILSNALPHLVDQAKRRSRE